MSEARQGLPLCSLIVSCVYVSSSQTNTGWWEDNFLLLPPPHPHTLTLHVKYWFSTPLQLDVKRWSSVLFLVWLIKVMGSWVGLNQTPPFAVSSHLGGFWKLDPNKNVIIDVWWRLRNWELLGFGSKCLVRFFVFRVCKFRLSYYALSQG